MRRFVGEGHKSIELSGFSGVATELDGHGAYVAPTLRLFAYASQLSRRQEIL